MSRALIVEGVVATGKTSLFERLRARPPLVGAGAALALSELYTERAVEPASMDLPPPSVAASRHHLTGLLRQAKDLDVAFSRSKFATERPTAAPVFLWERGHLSHALSFGEGNFGEYRDIDRRLAALGFRLLLLVAPEKTLRERLGRTRAEREASWGRYLDRKIVQRGPKMSEWEADGLAAAHYAAQQEKLVELAERSACPAMVLDTGSRDPETIAAAAVAFWTSAEPVAFARL